MALKDKWNNKVDGLDDVLAEDINNIAKSVIDLEDKTFSGTVGNVIVFGEHGKQQDGDTPPHFTYYITYDDSGDIDDKNKETIKAIIEAHENGKSFSVFVVDGGTLAPAVIEFASNTCMISYDNFEQIMNIKYYVSSDRIEYGYYDLYDGTFSETATVPATQKAIAEWVKTYVDDTLLIDTEVVL